MNHVTLCPCQSGKTYQTCCESLHSGVKIAETAEQLMRSRYCAFVMKKVDYLLATLHANSHQVDEQESLQQAVNTTQWIGLKILSHQASAHEAKVEFVAFYQADDIAQLHEHSNFMKEDGHWFYVDGTFLPDIKLGRNDLCFCGSGKKFKRCHASH